MTTLGEIFKPKVYNPVIHSSNLNVNVPYEFLEIREVHTKKGETQYIALIDHNSDPMDWWIPAWVIRELKNKNKTAFDLKGGHFTYQGVKQRHDGGVQYIINIYD